MEVLLVSFLPNWKIVINTNSMCLLSAAVVKLNEQYEDFIEHRIFSY